MPSFQAGERLTQGVVWRGIGPAIPGEGQGRPFTVDAEKVIFRGESFYDTPIPHPDPSRSNEKQIRPSVLIAELCNNQPDERMMQMKIAKPSSVSLAGLEVREIINVTQVPSSTLKVNPKIIGTRVLALEVIFKPEAQLPSHALISPSPEYHPRKVHDHIREILATLATDYFRLHGWVSPPTH